MQGIAIAPVQSVADKTGEVSLVASDIPDVQALSEKDQPNGYPGLDASGQLVGPIITRTGTLAQLDALTLDAGELAVATDLPILRVGDGSVSGGHDAGLGSQWAVVCRPVGLPTANATALRAAYTYAASLTPGGSALSASNRAAVLVLPGVYDFDGGDASDHGLELDTDFVDLIGVGGDPDQVLLTSTIDVNDRGTVERTCDDVRVCNLHIHQGGNGSTGTTASPSAYWIDAASSAEVLTDLHLTATRDTVHDGACMRMGMDYAGTYLRVICGDIDDVATGDHAFGGQLTGTSTGDMSGYAEDCKGGRGAFGGLYMNTGGGVSGTCVRCRAGMFSFGSNALGGGNGLESTARLYYCVAGGISMTPKHADAKTLFCVVNNAAYANND
jgi:hypothetical protein